MNNVWHITKLAGNAGLKDRKVSLTACTFGPFVARRLGVQEQGTANRSEMSLEPHLDSEYQEASGWALMVSASPEAASTAADDFVRQSTSVSFSV